MKQRNYSLETSLETEDSDVDVEYLTETIHNSFFSLDILLKTQTQMIPETDVHIFVLLTYL